MDSNLPFIELHKTIRSKLERRERLGDDVAILTLTGLRSFKSIFLLIEPLVSSTLISICRCAILPLSPVPRRDSISMQRHRITTTAVDSTPSVEYQALTQIRSCINPLPLRHPFSRVNNQQPTFPIFSQTDLFHKITSTHPTSSPLHSRSNHFILSTTIVSLRPRITIRPFRCLLCPPTQLIAMRRHLSTPFSSPDLRFLKMWSTITCPSNLASIKIPDPVITALHPSFLTPPMIKTINAIPITQLSPYQAPPKLPKFVYPSSIPSIVGQLDPIGTSTHRTIPTLYTLLEKLKVLSLTDKLFVIMISSSSRKLLNIVDCR